MFIYVFGGEENIVFGGGEEDKVGILWILVVRINKIFYGVLVYEIGYLF